VKRLLFLLAISLLIASGCTTPLPPVEQVKVTYIAAEADSSVRPAVILSVMAQSARGVMHSPFDTWDRYDQYFTGLLTEWGSGRLNAAEQTLMRKFFKSWLRSCKSGPWKPSECRLRYANDVQSVIWWISGRAYKLDRGVR